MDEHNYSAYSDYQQVRIEGYDDSFVVKPGCRRTLINLIAKVALNDGVLLSRLWEGIDTRVTLSCNTEHVWHVTARPVLHNDSWCPTCAFDGQWKGHQPDRPRRSFKDVLQLAKAQGVEHLGTVSNVRDATSWRCAKGHTWEEPARAMRIRGLFCQKCHGRPAIMLRRAQQTARSRGGHCLSTEYLNNRMPMKWRCTFEHVWEAPWRKVGTDGTWCPACAGWYPTRL